MFGSAILDTAIGLIFVYLIVSLIVSAANELLAALFKLRAKNLLLGIQELLQDPSTEGLVTSFYKHPLIAGLAANGGDWGQKGYFTMPYDYLSPDKNLSDDFWTVRILQEG
jgi:hypothetical protein